jgi:hypothetical protein
MGPESLFQEKMERGRGHEPVLISKASHACFPVMYKPTIPGPRSAPTPRAAAVIVCLGQPGHLPGASRSAITSPSRARRGPQRPPSQPALYAPTRSPSRVAERTEKTQASEPRALSGSQPQSKERENQDSSQKSCPRSTKSPHQDPHPPPLLIPASLRPLRVSTSCQYTLSFSASLRCHYASGLKPAPSCKAREEEGSRKPFMVGAEDTGGSISPAPLQESSLAARSPRTISEPQPCIFNLASICFQPAGQRCSISP